MAEKSPKELINTLEYSTDIRSNVNTFSSRKHLFDFGIDSDWSLTETPSIPTLEEEFHHNQRGLHIDLERDLAFEENKLLANTDRYRKQTWIHFLRCLQNHNTIAEEEPTFVTLSYSLCDLFSFEEMDATFFALKFNGIIYLFCEKSVQIGTDKWKPHDYYYTRFLALMTQRGEMSSSKICFKVDRIDLKGNKLIVCHRIDANDKNGSPVYVKCRNISIDYELRKSLLFNWSHCMISGVPTFIRGRRQRSIVREVNVMDVQSIPEMCRDYWRPSKCFSFAYQSLEFIKSCIDSELQLYEFAVNSRNKSLSCFRHHTTDTFLPEFYINSDLVLSENRSEKSPKEPIKTFKYKSDMRSEINSFNFRKHLFDFGIGSDSRLTTNRFFPSLKEEFHQKQINVNITLERGLENKELWQTRKIKWIQFLRCLQENDIIEKERPTFVSFTPIIAELFVVEEADTTFFALKFNGVIYLYRDKSLEEQEDNNWLEYHYSYSSQFKSIITDRNTEEENVYMSVGRIDLKDNQLIVCNTIDAIDRNGSPLYVKCRQIYFETEFKQKLLTDWSLCMISGIPTVIRGRRQRSTLKEVRVLEVNEIPKLCRDYWSPSKCFSYLDQTLDFIKSCVDSELVLFEFVIKNEDKSFDCFRHDSTQNSDHFLPDFYTQS